MAVRRIGFLNSAPEAGFEALKGRFLHGLADAGFHDGKEVSIVCKWAGGNYGRLEDLARDLVREDVEIIASTGGYVAAKAAISPNVNTKNIPVLFTTGTKPVGLVFASGDSFAPGRDAGVAKGAMATGVDVSGTDHLEPRLRKFCKLVAPAPKKIALLARASDPHPDIFKLERDVWAPSLQLEVIEMSATTDDNEFARELSDKLGMAIGQGVDGLVVGGDPFFTSKRNIIVGRVNERGLRAAYPWREYVLAGGLMSYGARLADAYYKIGFYAGQLLKRIERGNADTKGLPFVIGTPEWVINGQTAIKQHVDITTSVRAEAEVIYI
jgi:putative tryptophan/tyrosine transport system substrate-binding protein